MIINNLIKRCLFLFATSVFIILSAQWSVAANFYVSRCAPFPGNGLSPSSPFHTVGEAVSAAISSRGADNIFVKGGSYPETLPVTSTESNIYSYDGIASIGKYHVGWRDVVINGSFGDSTNARIYYPANEPGGNDVVCRGYRFPAVVYAHGRSFSDREFCDGWSAVPNSEDYTQAGGILTRLAASGMIIISFDWITPTGGEEGAPIIDDFFEQSLEYLRAHNETPSSWLERRVDVSSAGLLGHSTGGAHALKMSSSMSGIKAVALIAPFPYQPNYDSTIPMLVIHGTRESSAQVGITPLAIYCMRKAPKHLVVLGGANHFGYTDGICLDPKPEEEPAYHFAQDPERLLPSDGGGSDNFSYVGGLKGKNAHALQQLAAGNYIQSFFSYYLRPHQPDYSDMPGYLRQKTGKQCGGLGPSGSYDPSVLECNTKEVDVYMHWPVHSLNLCSGDGGDEDNGKVRISGNGTGDLTVNINQNKNKGEWVHVGTYVAELGVKAEIFPLDGCSVIADAVKYVTAAGREYIIDEIEDDPDVGSVSIAGDWNNIIDESAYHKKYLMSSHGDPVFKWILEFSHEIDTSNCDPVSKFEEFQSRKVDVKVCSCTSAP